MYARMHVRMYVCLYVHCTRKAVMMIAMAIAEVELRVRMSLNGAKYF